MAGSKSYIIKNCYIGGKLNPVKALEVSFVADAADGSYPVFDLPADFGGILMDTSVVFGSPAPNTLTFSLKDGYGLTLDSGTITASTLKGRLSQSLLLANGGSVTLTGNTTNSAKVKVIFYVI